MCALKIISVNARGLNLKEKREKLYSWISDTNIYICFYKKYTALKKTNFGTIVIGQENQLCIFRFKF